MAEKLIDIEYGFNLTELSSSGSRQSKFYKTINDIQNGEKFPLKSVSVFNNSNVLGWSVFKRNKISLSTIKLLSTIILKRLPSFTVVPMEKTESVDQESPNSNTGNVTISNKQKIKKFLPIIFLLFGLTGGFLGTAATTGTAATMAGFSDMIAETFNTQSLFVNNRSIALLLKKTNKTINATNRGLNKKINKIKKPSQKMIDSFRSNNIELNFDGSSKKIKSMTYNNVEIDVTDTKTFKKTLVEDPKFRRSVNQSMRGHFGSMHDIKAKTVFKKLGVFLRPLQGIKKKKISSESESSNSGPDQVEGEVKSKNIGDAIDDELNTRADAFGDGSVNPKVNVDTDAKKALNDIDNSPMESNAKIKAKEGVNKFKSLQRSIVENKYTSKVSSLVGSKGFNVFDIVTDVVSGSYAFLMQIQKIVLDSNLIKKISLSRYSAAFLSTMSAAKAGDTTEEALTSSFNKLVKTDVKTDGKQYEFAPNAFDSESYAYMNNDKKYLELEEMGPEAEKYQIGMGAKMSDVYEKTLSQVGGGGDIKWDFLEAIYGLKNSAIFQTAMLVVGIVGVIANPFAAAGAVVVENFKSNFISLAKESVINMIVSNITGMAANALTSGSDAMNAISSGAGFFLGQTAQKGGGLLLNKQQSIAYLKQHHDLMIAHAEEIESTTSPFDTSNRHTIMGKIKFSMLPYISKMNTVAGWTSSIMSLAKTSSAKSLLGSQFVSAASQDIAMIEKNLSLCKDPMITQMKDKNGNKAAFDMFCNPVFGLPTEYLEDKEENYSPDKVLNKIESWVDNKGNYERSYLKPVNRNGDCYYDQINPTKAELRNSCDDDWWYEVNNRKDTIYSKVDKCPPVHEECIDALGSKWISVGKSAGYRNNLNKFKINCINRGNIPFMLDPGKSLNEGLGGVTQQYVKERYGISEHDSKLLDNGGTCMLLGDTQGEKDEKVFFALYFMDQRTQCILDNDMECKY